MVRCRTKWRQAPRAVSGQCPPTVSAMASSGSQISADRTETQIPAHRQGDHSGGNRNPANTEGATDGTTQRATHINQA